MPKKHHLIMMKYCFFFFLQKKVEVKPAQPREVGPGGRGGGSKFCHSFGLFEKRNISTDFFIKFKLVCKSYFS